MLYIHSTTNETHLKYYCKNCDYTEVDSNPSGCIYENVYNTSYLTYDIITNKYTRYDPTLPRVKKMKCINESCISNSPHENIIILSDLTLYNRKPDVEAKIMEMTKTFDITTINIDDDTMLLKINNVSDIDRIREAISEVHRYTKYYDKIEPSIIFIKYDPENLKYVYICDYCNTSWKNK
jgi:hypothetical protein